MYEQSYNAIVDQAARQLGLNSLDLRHQFEVWSNTSGHTIEELLEYAYTYYWEKSSYSKLAMTMKISVLVISTFGLLGGFVEILVFRTPCFKTPSFLYHKLIIYSDVIGTLVNVAIQLMSFFMGAKPSSLKISAYRDLVAGTNFFSVTSTTLALTVSVERCVALQLPLYFDAVNRNEVVMAAALFSLAHATLYLFDFGPQTQKWWPAFVNARNATFIGIGVLQALASLIVTHGMLQMAKRVAAQHKQHGMDRHDIAKVKLTRQLAFLSLACAVPSIVNTVTLEVCQFLCATSGNGQCAVGDAAIVFPIEFALRFAVNNIVRTGVCVLNNIVFAVAHSTHYYFYVWLSVDVRRETKALLLKLRPTVRV